MTSCAYQAYAYIGGAIVKTTRHRGSAVSTVETEYERSDIVMIFFSYMLIVNIQQDRLAT